MELPSKRVRRAHSVKERKECTILAPGSPCNAAARRDVLNAVRMMIAMSNTIGNTIG